MANIRFLAWDVGAAIVPYVPGSYTVKGLKAGTKILSKADDYEKKGIWAMKAFDRGWEIEKALGGMCNNLPTNDKYLTTTTINGINFLSSVTSIKSIDITAKSYQGSGLKSLLKGYFSSVNYKDVIYLALPDARKVLEIAIPPVKMSSKQAKIFTEMKEYAEKNGVTITTRIVK